MVYLPDVGRPARELSQLPLQKYRPPQISVDCARCRRHGVVTVATLKLGENATVGDLVRHVAHAGKCQLAMGEPYACNAIPIEPPVEQWAELQHAQAGDWTLWLQCARRMAALKATKSCPGPIAIDVRSLVAAFGFDKPLGKLRLICPGCGSVLVHTWWEVPPVPNGTDPAAAEPTKPVSDSLYAEARSPAARKLRVVGGG